MGMPGYPGFFLSKNMNSISIIIPVKPDGEIAALTHLLSMSAYFCRVEIIIAEGNSPSSQRNLAAHQAHGSILYFLDDDSCILTCCIHELLRSMDDESVAVVGGPSITPWTDTWFQQLAGAVLTSFFGAGGVRNRYRSVGITRETSEKELILCNLAIRASVFKQFGGFDERLYPNEENELLDRISASGLKLIHNPAMQVLRSQRKTLKAFIRQMYSYGRGRAQQTLVSKKVSWVSFVPLFFVVYLIAFVVCQISLLMLVPLLLYLLLDIVFTTQQVVMRKSPLFYLLFFLFPVMHIANGFGLLRGFVLPAIKKQTSKVTIRRIQNIDCVNEL